MSEFLVKMEMPVTCCHCPLMGYDPDIEWNDGVRDVRGAYICVLTGELIDNTKLEEHCPLVPVPPHGRLIDADALEQDAQKRLLMCDKNDNQFQRPYEVIRAIALAPTVIPASEEGET